MVTPYNLIIMKHYRHPAHKGRLKKPDVTFSGANYSCGDSLTFTVKLDRQKRISEVGWDGTGCAISQASASIFSDLIIGKTLAQIQKMRSDTLVNKLKLPLSPMRRKCAVLPLYAITKEG